MEELSNILEKLKTSIDNYGGDALKIVDALNAINDIAIGTIETDAMKSFIDSLLSIPAFDEYDEVFSSFKETIYLDRLSNSKKARGKMISLEKDVINVLKSSNVFDPSINKELMSFFKEVNSIQSVTNLEKKNKERLKIEYEYDSLMFDYKRYKEAGLIDGVKEVQDIFGGTKIVPFEIPSKEMVDEKNRLDQKLNEFKRVKEMIEKNPEFTSTIKSVYPKTLNKLDEYIEEYELKVKMVNESLGKTDYKEIKEAVLNARLEHLEKRDEKDLNKENILEAKKAELENLKVQNPPNYSRIEALQAEIKALEKEKKEENTLDDQKDEELSEEKNTFEKSDDEEILEKASFIDLREEASKRIFEENPNALEQLGALKYEELVNEYMHRIRDERVKNRDLKDVEFDLYKQDRTLTDEVEDKNFDEYSEKIEEYENVANLYIEKENEILDESLKNGDEFKSMLEELEQKDEIDLSDYERLLEELDKEEILSYEEASRKLA